MVPSRRSIAPTEVSTKAGEAHGASLVAIRQEREEHLHLLAVLLDIADVVDDKSLESTKTLQLVGQPQVALRDQEPLDQERARREEDPDR
jgi:hypothetical protein